MRQIKFRVWDKVANKWLDYEEIYFDQEGEVYLIEERTWSYQSYMHKENITEKVDVVRFTGLKDKDGKEIYEGDVVRMYSVMPGCNIDEIGIVKFIECAFLFEKMDGSNGWSIFNEATEIEVVGNIYENPELLK